MDTEYGIQLRLLYDQVAGLKYAHREGGKYPYVKFLSLLRDLPDILPEAEKEELTRIQLIAAELNRRLSDTFSDAEERFFEQGRAEILRIISNGIARTEKVRLRSLT